MDNINKKKHTCLLCNYKTNLKSHYDKHLKTKKHKNNENNKNYEKNENSGNSENNENNENSENSENSEKYENVNNKNTNKIYIIKCELCNFQFSTKFNYDRHLKSIKHIKNSSTNHNCICGKSFISIDLLDKHKLLCVSHYKMININNDDNKLHNIIEMQQNMIVEQHQQISDQSKQITEQYEQLKKQNKQITMQLNHMSDQAKQMTEIIPKIGHTQNNNFNINVFLNENCKNALNMSDFLKSITISLEQLDFTKNHGLEKGITKVITDNINKLSLTERPIHCTDMKRETLYIKDNNIWEKDKDKSKIKQVIQKTSNKNYSALSDWSKENPDFLDNENKQDYYTKTITTIGKPIENIDKKIIKTLCKENYIKE